MAVNKNLQVTNNMFDGDKFRSLQIDCLFPILIMQIVACRQAAISIIHYEMVHIILTLNFVINTDSYS